MKRPLLALPLLLLAVFAGCGSNDAAPAVDESDKPGSTVACLEAQGVTAHVQGKDDDEVLLDAGPRVKFYLTAAEAEAGPVPRATARAPSRSAAPCSSSIPRWTRRPRTSSRSSRAASRTSRLAR